MKYNPYKLSQKAFGTWAERRARSYYLRSGYRIISQNWCTQIPENDMSNKLKGELDLVAISPDNVLCFIEVKASRKQGVTPEWAVNTIKRKQIKALANIYIFKYQLDDYAVQFQVFSLRAYKNSWKLKLYESAFI
jgi:Holliday junction resolvase-like predicted endonuclease